MQIGDKVYWYYRYTGMKWPRKAKGTIQTISVDGTMARIKLDDPGAIIKVMAFEVKRLHLLDKK